MVTALMTARLRDADEALSRKLNAANVQVGLGSGGRALTRSRFNLTERRVLALVRAARAMAEGIDLAPVPPTSALAPGPSRFAVLGSAGFELPAYGDMFAAYPGWRAQVMRRGSERPFRSLVDVPTSTFLRAVGAQTLTDAGANPAAVKRAEAFTMGLTAALAYETVAGPVRRGGYARRTSKPWNRRQPGDVAQADATAALRRLIGGDDPVATFRQWWPTATDATALLAGYHKALEATYGLEARATPANEPFGVGGPALTPTRVRSGYERLLSDQVPWTMGEWFGVLTPILLAPAITLAVGGALPGMGAFLKASTVTERSISELVTLGDFVNSITPFIASMVLWANVPDQPNEPFVSALWTFLARVGLTAGWLPTIGSDTDDPSPGARWGLAGGHLGLDLYQLIRWLAARGARQPGPAVVFGLQNVTAIMTVVTLVQAGLAKGMVAIAKEAGADDDGASIAGWVTMGVTAVGLWLGAGLPVAKALSRGGGWMSWFTTDDLPSLRGALAGDRSTDTMDAAAVFDDSTLWFDPATATPGLADLRYPTGGRPLVKVWRASGTPELQISPRGSVILIRDGATDTTVTIGPGARTVGDIVTALTGVTGIHAAAADDEVAYELPWPATVVGPADAADPRPPVGSAAHTAFVPIPDNENKPYLLRHAADATIASHFGTSGRGRSPFDGLRGVPRAPLGDTEDTVLGTSADLAVLLGLGVASGMRTVQALTPSPDPLLVPAPPPAVAARVGPVDQVFRRWNLDHRRVNEWRTIVAGGAAPDAAFPADPTLSTGAGVAHAMGWVPLWRAWLRVAADTQEDTSTATISPDTPFVQAADGTRSRPTNAQLTAAIRYVLDLDP
jgi:hypothetical protein